MLDNLKFMLLLMDASSQLQVKIIGEYRNDFCRDELCSRLTAASFASLLPSHVLSVKDSLNSGVVTLLSQYTYTHVFTHVMCRYFRKVHLIRSFLSSHLSSPLSISIT